MALLHRDMLLFTFCMRQLESDIPIDVIIRQHLKEAFLLFLLIVSSINFLSWQIQSQHKRRI